MIRQNAQPVHEIRIGAVKATIWENHTDSGTRHNVSVFRLFKEGENWKQTTSFGRDDLLTLAKVVDLAHSWIHESVKSNF